MCAQATLQTPLNTGFLPIFGNMTRLVCAWVADSVDGQERAVVPIQR